MNNSIEWRITLPPLLSLILYLYQFKKQILLCGKWAWMAIFFGFKCSSHSSSVLIHVSKGKLTEKCVLLSPISNCVSLSTLRVSEESIFSRHSMTGVHCRKKSLAESLLARNHRRYLNTYALDYNCWGYLPAVTRQTTTGSWAWNPAMFNSCQRKPGTLPVYIYQWNGRRLLMFGQWCLSVSVRELCMMSAVLIVWVFVGNKKKKKNWGWRNQSCWCMRKDFQSITPRVDIIRVKLLPPSAGYIASF